MVGFDVAIAIIEFLADSSCTSIELPHLTTGQRKHAKALIQQQPELRCESYGFGTDRRLHLFKIGCADMTKLDMPLLHKAGNVPLRLPVRNTFIHIEESPIDERAVQSMPPGMFSQCLLAEASQKEMDNNEQYVSSAEADASRMPVFEPEAEPVVSSFDTPAPSAQVPFGIGALVTVEGLTKLPAFNGLSAVVQGWDEASGRYSIMLVTSDSGCQQAKVKAENIRLLMACP